MSEDCIKLNSNKLTSKSWMEEVKSFAKANSVFPLGLYTRWPNRRTARPRTIRHGNSLVKDTTMTTTLKAVYHLVDVISQKQTVC